MESQERRSAFEEQLRWVDIHVVTESLTILKVAQTEEAGNLQRHGVCLRFNNYTTRIARVVGSPAVWNQQIDATPGG